MNKFAVITLAVMAILVTIVTARPIVSHTASAAVSERWQSTIVKSESAATLQANHIVYDPVRDRLYASVPANNDDIGNSVVSFARNGQVSDPIAMGSEPNVMVLSSRAQYLYVGLDGAGALRRLDLNTLALGPIWPLGNDITCGTFMAGDMVSIADDPNAVIVARHNPCWSRHAGVVVFDDGVPRPSTTPSGSLSYAIEPSDDPAKVFGFDSRSTGQEVQKLAIGANGVDVTQVVPDLLTGYADDIRYHGGRLYATNGDVISADDLTYIGRFEVPAGTSLPVIRDDRAFFLVYDPAALYYELLIYHASSFRFLASTPVIGLNDQNPGKSIDFIDAGRGSMAVRVGDGRVYWLQVQLVQYTAYLPVSARGGKIQGK